MGDDLKINLYQDSWQHLKTVTFAKERLTTRSRFEWLICEWNSVANVRYWVYVVLRGWWYKDFPSLMCLLTCEDGVKERLKNDLLWSTTIRVVFLGRKLILHPFLVSLNLSLLSLSMLTLSMGEAHFNTPLLKRINIPSTEPSTGDIFGLSAYSTSLPVFMYHSVWSLSVPPWVWMWISVHTWTTFILSVMCPMDLIWTR